MLKCTLIINPHSGRHRKINIDKITKIFLKYNYDVDVIFTKYKNHAQEITERSISDLVVSVGGDGTFNEVMTGNFNRESRILIAHIPIGTANDIGTMYGFKKSLYKNIELLLSGSVRGIDICTINDKPFTYVAALGKFTNVSYDTPRRLKKSFGYLAYLIEGLKELKNPTIKYSFKYIIDGVEHKTNSIFMLISNANRIAGINDFYHNIKLDDNLFEVLFCTLDDRKKIVKSLYHLKDGDISTLEGFRFYKTNNLKIIFDEPIKKNWSVDGEELLDKTSIFEVKIVRDVKVLIPNKNIKKLFVEG